MPTAMKRLNQQVFPAPSYEVILKRVCLLIVSM